MKIVVISDIHITGAEDPLYRSLLEMIRSEVSSSDQLVLAGDIFDFFVGKQPSLIARYSELFDLLRAKGKSGAKLFYIEGNHDFLLEKVLSEIPGMTLSSSVIALEAGKKKIYIAHGDLVDEADRGYLALRAFFRSPFIRFVAFALPSAAVEWIGNRSSKASRNTNPRLPEDHGEENLKKLRSVYQGFARRKFREGYDAVVLGHCHDLDGADFSEGSRTGRYLNVGFPRVHGSYVVFTESAGLERKPLASFSKP